MDENITILNKTKSKLPSLPFSLLKDAILGKKYELSIAVVTPKEIQKPNKIYREKDEATDVLSFRLEKKSGELLLCPTIIKKKAPLFEKNYEDYFLFAVIHGMLHLKGMDHGSTMEAEEKRFLRKFTNA